MNQSASNRVKLAEDAEKLLGAAILSNLEMTYEERIEAHENSRQLMMDLQAAGGVLRAAESQSSS